MKTLTRLFSASLLFVAIGFTLGCTGVPEDVTVIQDIGGAGKFYTVNVSTRDTVETAFGLTVGKSYSELKVKNGDEIKLYFVPADIYSGYTFNVSYTLPDSTKVDGIGKDYSYSFELSGLEQGSHIVSMSANSTKQSIHVSGEVSLKVIE